MIVTTLDLEEGYWVIVPPYATILYHGAARLKSDQRLRTNLLRRGGGTGGQHFVYQGGEELRAHVR
jgi:hypothetical protein